MKPAKAKKKLKYLVLLSIKMNKTLHPLSVQQENRLDGVLQVKRKWRGGDAVVVEDLEVLVDFHVIPQEHLQLLYGHLVNAVALLGVFGQGRVGREADADVVRRVAVVLGAAVGRPHIFGDGHAVLVVASDPVSPGGDAGDDECDAAAEVVEAHPDPLLVLAPRPDVELPDLWDDVGERVGGGPVVRGGLVLVGIQVASLVKDHVGVVVQNRLAVLELHVQVAGGEGKHVAIPVDFCQLWLEHPGVVHPSVSLGLLEGVRRVNRDALFGVVQGHISRLVGVALADLLQFAVDDPPRRSPHVERVLAPLHMIKILHNCCTEQMNSES